MYSKTISKLLYTGIIALMICLQASCTKQAPQLPFNKSAVSNSTNVNLLELNQKLIEKEDSLINAFVLKKEGNFKRSELGFWHLIDKNIKSNHLNQEETCKFDYTMSFLDNTVIEKGTKEIEFGKKQLIIGVEEGLKLMKHGETATLIIPWYLAYGMSGHQSKVPPYTSLIFIISAH